MCIHGYVESEFCMFPTDCTSSQSIIVGELKVQRNAEIINTTSFDYPALPRFFFKTKSKFINPSPSNAI